MAQLVEHNLAKVGVAGSSPVVRSIEFLRHLVRGAFFVIELTLLPIALPGLFIASSYHTIIFK